MFYSVIHRMYSSEIFEMMNSRATRNSPNWLLSNIERNAFLLFQSSICCVKFTLFKDCSPLTLIVLLVYTLEESTFVPV